MCKVNIISIILLLTAMQLLASGSSFGTEVNVGFKGKFANLPVGANESSLAEAGISDLGLQTLLADYGVSSIEKLIPEFDPSDRVGVTRTGEIVQLTNYSRFFVLKFHNDVLADAFLADAKKEQWIFTAEKSQAPILCVSADLVPPRSLSAAPDPNDPKCLAHVAHLRSKL